MAENLFDGRYKGFLFDMDGVLTNTASLHSTAWKTMFDEYLQKRSLAMGSEFVEFDLSHDYLSYIDGKVREDGVRDFLTSRGIALPEGTDADSANEETVFGLGRHKNELVMQLLDQQGVILFEGSIEVVRRARQFGFKTAVVSSSRHTEIMLATAGIDDLFDARVDGTVAGQLGLASKPAPDMFLEGARRIAVAPEEAVVFEDARAGVAAGRAGAFALVVGVDRHDERDALLASGADIVVNDLSELLS